MTAAEHGAPMRLKAIACEILAREVYLAAATSPHTVDVELVSQSLHSTPQALQAELQRRVDAASSERYDAVLLAYGLCSNATVGLQAQSKPLVLPRAHDCITLYLGSRSRYEAEFLGHPGTYYYSDDWIERSSGSNNLSGLGASSESDARVQATYEEYVRKYGEDNARYLMEVMGAWREHYTRAAYIDMGIVALGPCRARALEEAERRGWEFASLQGDLTLIRRLVHGAWDEDILVLLPGQAVLATYGPDVMQAAGDGGQRPPDASAARMWPDPPRPSAHLG